jgi:hypothetical protein
MERVNCVDGDKIYSVYWCEFCQKVLAKMGSFNASDGFAFGELQETQEFVDLQNTQSKEGVL